MSVLANQIEMIRALRTIEVTGTVASVRGLVVRVDDLPLPIGSVVRLDDRRHSSMVRGEVVGFDGPTSIIMLYGGTDHVSPGERVVGEQSWAMAQTGRSLLGRIIDGLGRPLDGGSPPPDTTARPLHAATMNAMKRGLISKPLPTGVRVIDSLLTLGRGQRMGIFAGPGVGKSSLLAAIARNTAADVNVIALIGERGREVREFIEHTLGEEGLSRSVVIVSTGDESPLLRVRAALLACAVSEQFRDEGRHVMLMMDSVTRLAQAQRQIGLSAGEPPATKGYTPSVFSIMSRVLERAGAMHKGGSITGMYTILVEGDDMTEPVADAARGILDGHIALSRRLASRGHYPAVDVLDSISRVADHVCDEAHVAARRLLVRLLAAYRESEELINIGAYVGGSNPETDVAIEMKRDLDAYLMQSSKEGAEYPWTCRRLLELAVDARSRIEARRSGRVKGKVA